MILSCPIILKQAKTKETYTMMGFGLLFMLIGLFQLSL
jgi:hypothetical protein